jgi:hypothetical protein
MDADSKAATFKFLISQLGKHRRPINEAKASMPRDDSNVIGVRMRPLLPHEVEGERTEGVFQRSKNVVDLHNMVTGLPRGPVLHVCLSTA